VSGLEATENSLRGEVASAKDRNTLLELEVSSTDLREKLEMYEEILKQLEEYQDKLMEPLRTRLAEIDTDFTRCCMRFQENFHPHLLNDDFNSVIRELRDLNFPLLQELSTKKDASTWDIMDLLRLDDAVAETLGMTDLQPDASQLMVPVYHKQDKVIIGSQALSVALDICRGRVEKME
ncbi:hypothetical protein Tco_0288264, partial [Tanacetum coccineum]